MYSLFHRASCQVLHGAPRATGWGHEQLIRYFSLKTSKKLIPVGFQVKVPTSLIAEDLDMSSHAISHLGSASSSTVDLPDDLLLVVKVVGHIAMVVGMGLLKLQVKGLELMSRQ